MVRDVSLLRGKDWKVGVVERECASSWGWSGRYRLGRVLQVMHR